MGACALAHGRECICQKQTTISSTEEIELIELYEIQPMLKMKHLCWQEAFHVAESKPDKPGNSVIQNITSPLVMLRTKEGF